jgi:hypothetical protein
MDTKPIMASGVTWLLVSPPPEAVLVRRPAELVFGVSQCSAGNPRSDVSAVQFRQWDPWSYECTVFIVIVTMCSSCKSPQ